MMEGAGRFPRAFFSLLNLMERTVLYISPSCETVTGYARSQFIEGGMPFIFSIATRDSVPKIIETHNQYIRYAKQPDFDPRAPIVHRYDHRIRTGAGIEKDMAAYSMALTYSKTADIQLGMSLVMEDDAGHLRDGLATMIRIKERHNSIYVHPEWEKHEEPLHKLHILKPDNSKLPREEEVLRLLAKGLTSTRIAEKLFIEENTVETHRKKLLAKFDAKNIAELIKKASKIYWLD